MSVVTLALISGIVTALYTVYSISNFLRKEYDPYSKAGVMFVYGFVLSLAQLIVWAVNK